MDIDAGRFMDLLEIDAASNTGVDDVRELIDNAQYMPSRGRVKVYLIDEVHMLSKAAFNALLKTLEEPPGHVKFLLATTDPQKLPVTVLSRCLQFNLKRLSEEQIAGQMRHILQAEQLPSDDAGIALLARAADGSLRDGLSLLDQAIAYTSTTLDEAGIAAMLGTVDRNQVAGLLRALDGADGAALMAVVADMATYSPDYGAVLDALASALHRVQLAQLIPGSMADTLDLPVAELASSLPADLVQLWYQIAISGRRELPLAPSPLVGFEMCLLRMLAFRPEEPSAAGNRPAPVRPASAAASSGRRTAPAASHATASSPPIAHATPQPTAQVREAVPVVTSAQAPAASATTLASAEQWLDVIEQAGLRGPVRELAAHAAFVDYQAPLLQLALPQGMDYLHSDAMLDSLSAALAPALGQRPQIRFQIGAAAPSDTLHQRRAREREQRQSDAEAGFMADPAVQHLVNAYGARVLPDSIRPLKEN